MSITVRQLIKQLKKEKNLDAEVFFFDSENRRLLKHDGISDLEMDDRLIIEVVEFEQ